MSPDPAPSTEETIQGLPAAKRRQVRNLIKRAAASPQVHRPTPSTLGTYYRGKHRIPIRCSVIAQTSSGNYMIEYRNANGHLRREIVKKKNLTIYGGN